MTGPMVSALAPVVQVNQMAGVLIAVVALVLQSLPIVSIRRAGKEDAKANQHTQQ